MRVDPVVVRYLFVLVLPGVAWPEPGSVICLKAVPRQLSLSQWPIAPFSIVSCGLNLLFTVPRASSSFVFCLTCRVVCGRCRTHITTGILDPCFQGAREENFLIQI
jgi:hypothetical protein